MCARQMSRVWEAFATACSVLLRACCPKESSSALFDPEGAEFKKRPMPERFRVNLSHHEREIVVSVPEWRAYPTSGAIIERHCLFLNGVDVRSTAGSVSCVKGPSKNCGHSIRFAMLLTQVDATTS
jgi:hypothetical protein